MRDRQGVTSSALRSGLIALAALSVAAPAVAHHALTMYDRETARSVQGVVKEFQWTNPHSWIQLVVPQDGKAVAYGIESSSPGVLSRKGWSSDVLKPGDKVTVVVHPLKTGEPGGLLVHVILADGTTLSRQ